MLKKQYYRKKKIKKPSNARRFVIGDIHGCYHTLKKLVEKKINLKKDDQLFLLGDYINKGPYSKKTLDYIIELIKKGYKIYPLRGNHEETLINTYKNEEKAILKWLVRKSPDLLIKGKLKEKYKIFIKSLRYYYKLDEFYLVHANFNYNCKKPFKDKTSMLWKRKFDYNSKILKGKIIIHGHQPTNIDEIKKTIKKNKSIIGIDNGVNYTKAHKIYDYKKMGNLCALNLDTFELTIQKNIEDLSK